MAKSLLYNNHDFQNSYFRTKDIIYRNLPTKVLDLEPKIRRDGFHVINTYYDSKDITISGTLTRDTEANLKTSIDSMKEALHTDEANLDIDDGGTTIRWVCSVQSINVPEEHYHITRIPYEITFRCQPLGKLTTSTTETASVTTTSSSDDFNPTGSAPPLPTLKWTCTTAPTAAITSITFENTTTSKSITVSSLALDANGDYLEIDCDAMTSSVSYDGGDTSEVDYTGVFPTFETDTNSYSVTIVGGGASFALEQSIEYYQTYL